MGENTLNSEPRAWRTKTSDQKRAWQSPTPKRDAHGNLVFTETRPRARDIAAGAIIVVGVL